MNAGPIVVGVDGTPAGGRALRWAMDEATLRNVPLHVVHAYQHEAMTDWTMTSEQDTQARAESLVEDALRAAAVGRSELPQVVRRCVRGPAAEALEAQARGASMLVVAAHNGSRLLRAVLGSTSAHCVRHATVPVVVLPPEQEQDGEATVGSAREGER
ncbi:nucleotide-binding universal stress UspA family protein [Saccharothrix tamanrassetensis]|uniref:Nucleotide-binding universal stress UspA family protein n=1 Tax=Saccharothrix tamanrassetensis TaxID=1051531 RepID=A0A841CWS3_9PSEU|nr:universal stress protein [Saccharothrix tamanrassetensis]MBB5960447.1 nucleotide-binding universal stress UspA family protein [Saccharothrix tamanrassetensis]